MWTESGPLRQMRSIVRAQLPPRAFLRLDREDCLFVTNAPAFDPSLKAIAGFTAVRKGVLLRLLPDESWVARLERRPAPKLGLAAELARFRGLSADLENIKLFARCLKATDSGTDAEIQLCERAVRQRAAAALRGACGGALYACALLIQMRANIHGED